MTGARGYVQLIYPHGHCSAKRVENSDPRNFVFNYRREFTVHISVSYSLIFFVLIVVVIVFFSFFFLI
jgi:hypothetical protein